MVSKKIQIMGPSHENCKNKTKWKHFKSQLYRLNSAQQEGEKNKTTKTVHMIKRLQRNPAGQNSMHLIGCWSSMWPPTSSDRSFMYVNMQTSTVSAI